MRAVYVSCIADPYLDVAINLKKEKDIEPIYWIGDIDSAKEDDDVKKAVLETFPGISYQGYFDAWHGVFNREIEEKANTEGIDVDFLRNYASQEFQALSMMDRLDYDRKSFCFMERERYFIRLVRMWMAMFDIYKPDIVIAANNPHRVFDYVLYLVCKYRSVRFISSTYTRIMGRMLMVEDFANPHCIADIFDEAYEKALQKKLTMESLPDDIRKSIDKLSQSYDKAKPYYMSSFVRLNSKNKNLWFLLQRFMKYHSLFGDNSIFKGQKLTIYKNSKYKIEDWRFSLWKWYAMRRDANKYRKKLYNHYCSLVEEVSLDVPYVIFFLHYQPEENTSPNGDIFVNQYLCILTLLKNLPNNVMVYVKEHPHMFMSHRQGQTKRIRDFYDDLAAIPRVRLVNFAQDSYSLIDKAMAVSTVTGTVGWEAAVRKKPVILFGLIWFERMPGVIRVYDEKDAKRIYDFIKNFRYDEHAMLAYLEVFAQKSYTAYNYSGRKALTGYSHDNSVNNISKALKNIIFKDEK